MDAHPGSVLAEEALNNLATHYVLVGDDEQAAQVLAELYARFPDGRARQSGGVARGVVRLQSRQVQRGHSVLRVRCRDVPAR